MTILNPARATVAALAMLFCLSLPASATAQTPDTLPQLVPSDYIPSSLPGFALESRAGLNRSDRQVMRGVQTGAKAYWVRPDRPFRIAVFDVMTDVFRFDSPANARRSIQADFKKRTGQFGRDTIAGLSVVTVAYQGEGTADFYVGYQQGTLGIDVSATQSVTSGSADLADLRKAAHRAFRRVVETVRARR